MDDVLQKAAGWPGIEKLSSAQDVLNRNRVLISQVFRLTHDSLFEVAGKGEL